MRLFWKYLRKILPYFIFSVLCMGIESSVELLQPTLMADIVDVGVANGDLNYVLRTSALMMGAVLLYAGAAFGRSNLSARGANLYSYYLRADIYRKVQSMTPDELDRFGAGPLMTRITNDISQLENMVMMLMRVFVKAPILCIGGIVMAWQLNAQLALIPIVATAVIFVLIYFNLKYGFPLYSKVQTALDRVNTIIREYLSGVRVVKAFNRFDFEMKRFARPNEELRATSTFASRVMAVFNPTVTLIIYSGMVVLLWQGGVKVSAGVMQTGQIIAFVSYMMQILQSLNMFSNIFQRIVRSRASLQRLVEVNEALTVEVPENPAKLDLSQGLVFEDAGFSYQHATGRPALRHVSFRCGIGERVGVIGATGSGKTTLISLILQFYAPTEGKVKVFGADVRESDPGEVRSHLAVVPQRVVLFTGTIYENLLWGKEDATREEVEEAARIARAHDFITAFPEGYETLIGHSGVNLSGGQRQRIAIARALIKKPRILILDDCLSAVDALTEASIRESLAQCATECGCLIVSQKISSIIDADRIVVLDDGEAVGVGRHEELLESCEVYRDIYLSQYGAGALQHTQPVKGEARA